MVAAPQLRLGAGRTLRPGVVFAAKESAPADPNDRSSNQIQFDERQGGLTGVPSSGPGAQVGSLYVRELAGVPPNTAAVGIGMSNAPVSPCRRSPTRTWSSARTRSTGLRLGTFTCGQVFDPGQITGAARVTFDGTNSVNVQASPPAGPGSSMTDWTRGLAPWCHWCRDRRGRHGRQRGSINTSGTRESVGQPAVSRSRRSKNALLAGGYTVGAGDSNPRLLPCKGSALAS